MFWTRRFLGIALVVGLGSILLLASFVFLAPGAQASCPLYPNSKVVSSLREESTYESTDTFGKVLQWYENQHHRKAEVRAAPASIPVTGAVASYSLLVKDKYADYVVTVYKLDGKQPTFIRVVEAQEQG